MKTVAPHDRPREKLQRLGVRALGDNELVAMVLGHGQGSAGALDLANALLGACGGVHGLGRACPDDLRHVRGIGPARASQVLAAIELGRRTLTRAADERVQITNPRAAAEFLLPQYGNHPVEQFGVVLLDTKRRVLRTAVLSVGTLDSSIVHPRDVFREAARADAFAIILFHNHPSGDPAPSRDDVELTERFVQAGALMGIEIIDHMILSDQRYFSFSEAERR